MRHALFRGVVVVLIVAFATGMALGRVHVEQDGLVVLEAENYVSNVGGPSDPSLLVTDDGPGGFHIWQFNNTRAGYSGRGYLEMTPNDRTWIEPSFDPPYATYRIRITNPGTYYSFAREAVPVEAGAGGDDSLFIAIEGMEPREVQATRCAGLGEEWMWCFGDEGTPVAFDLEAGEHTLYLLMREDGTMVDQIGLTMDASLDVTNLGALPESPIEE